MLYNSNLFSEKLKKALELAPDEKIGFAKHESRQNKWEI
jgi:hypothetical protein